MSNLINSIRDYIITCPFLEDWRVNVDYLGTGMEYSIDPFCRATQLYKNTQMEEQKNSSNLLLPAVKNMITMRELTLKIVDFTRSFDEWLEEQDMAGKLSYLG